MTVEEALRILGEKGYRSTGKREALLRLLAREDRYLTAKEALRLMHRDYPDLSFDTIYRNLALFHELGIVHMTEFDGERRYRLRCPIEGHHHHLICLSCGTTQEILACPLDAMWGQPDGFIIAGHKFEVYGYCRSCAEATAH